MTHCGVVATNLAQSDPKYRQWASNFLGAAQTLAPRDAVLRMMMNDPFTLPKTAEQRAAAEKEVEGCQKLMFENMDKFGGQNNPSTVQAKVRAGT
jgi:sulfur transfer protein SufE